MNFLLFQHKCMEAEGIHWPQHFWHWWIGHGYVSCVFSPLSSSLSYRKIPSIISSFSLSFRCLFVSYTPSNTVEPAVEPAYCRASHADEQCYSESTRACCQASHSCITVLGPDCRWPCYCFSEKWGWFSLSNPSHIILFSNSNSARSAPSTASLAHTLHSTLLHILISPSLSLTSLSLRLLPSSIYNFTPYHETYFCGSITFYFGYCFYCIAALAPITNNTDDANTVSA